MMYMTSGLEFSTSPTYTWDGYILISAQQLIKHTSAHQIEKLYVGADHRYTAFRKTSDSLYQHAALLATTGLLYTEQPRYMSRKHDIRHAIYRCFPPSSCMLTWWHAKASAGQLSRLDCHSKSDLGPDAG